MKIIPIILCGGSGSRLWPLSRKNNPKQFLKIIDDLSLFQKTILRISSFNKIKIDHVIIITNEQHRFIVLEQLEKLKLSLRFKYKIILEPEQKNTAPAITIASLAANDIDNNSILIVMPSDHFIDDDIKLQKTFLTALENLKSKTFFIFGIKPSFPSIDFGYIEFDNNNLIKNVLSFKEKPKYHQAEKMISMKNYFWNSGIFVFKASDWINLISLKNNLLFDNVFNSWKNKIIDNFFIRPDKYFFAKLESNSIDYLVMENAKKLDIHLKMIPLDVGWSDVGTFKAFENIYSKDTDNNIFIGDINSINSKDNIAIATNRNISLLSLKDILVVETSDTVLVANLNDVQSIKKLVEHIQLTNPTLVSDHSRVLRPWGWFDVITYTNYFKVKRLHIKPGKAISLQKHLYRSEHWVIVAGKAQVTKGKITSTINENESIYIEVNELHRIKNITNEFLEIIEVQTGHYLGEDDIERFNDDYGRT